MKTKNVNLTVKLLVAVLMLISDIFYAQTHTITSKEYIKFNTNNNNNPTIAFDNDWNGTLKYQRNTGKFSFNKSLYVTNGHFGIRKDGGAMILSESNANATGFYLRRWNSSGYSQIGKTFALRIVKEGTNNHSFSIHDYGTTTNYFELNSDGSSAAGGHTRFYIGNTGNVGIGTTNPHHNLDVYRTGGAIVGVGDPNGEKVYVAAGPGANACYVGTRTNNDFVIKANNNTKMRIHTNGDVTINSGGNNVLNQVSVNTDSKVDHTALTVAGGVYIGPKADLASEDNLDRFDASYLEDFRLWVEDGIITERYGVSIVENHQWRDMVFNKDYALPSLDEVREYINTHGHLKDVPSAKEVEENGYDLVDMDATLLQKIEELMLYTLEQKQQIDDLKNEIQELKEEKNIKTINNKTKI